MRIGSTRLPFCFYWQARLAGEDYAGIASAATMMAIATLDSALFGAIPGSFFGNGFKMFLAKDVICEQDAVSTRRDRTLAHHAHIDRGGARAHRGTLVRLQGQVTQNRDWFLQCQDVRGLCDARSPYRLYDMAGNVWQWTGDVYQGTHQRYLRGGSKQNYEYNLRVWTRNSAPSDYSAASVGFRCAR